MNAFLRPAVGLGWAFQSSQRPQHWLVFFGWLSGASQAPRRATSLSCFGSWCGSSRKFFSLHGHPCVFYALNQRWRRFCGLCCHFCCSNCAIACHAAPRLRVAFSTVCMASSKATAYSLRSYH